MQVLGDLVRLPGNGSSLPLPWWQRAPLGLMDKTNVHVGLVQKASRPVGDIVVSVLDINKWDNMLRLECIHNDQRGVLASLMDAVLPLNIALAEAVTTEAGEHNATLFCEDKGTQKVKELIPRIKDEMRRKGFRTSNIDPYLSPTRLDIQKSCQTVVHHGWLQEVPFKAWIETHSDESRRNMIDLGQAVVSADTHNRLLRYIFPYKDAKTVRVHHRDRPGALRYIFNEFLACELNVLSALLRRGGQEEGYAELRAICEPGGSRNGDMAYDELRDRINSVDQQFDATIEFYEAKPAEEVIFLPPPSQVTPHGTRPVFFASDHRVRDDRHARLLDIVRQRLREDQWFPLEAPLRPDSNSESMESCSLMERCDAALILVTGMDEEGSEGIKFNILHGLGYLRALHKPVLLLIEQNSSKSCAAWPRNELGVLAEFAGGEDAFGTENPRSIAALVRDWSRQVRRKR